MTSWMLLIWMVLLGLCMGSFVNALVWRIKNKRDWIRERSECPHCGHVLAAKDLVPVLSWIYLHGKCRYCRKPIADSPVVELALPALYVVSYLFWPAELSGAGLFAFVLWALFLVGFMALAVYDLKWMLLPNVVVFPLIGLAVVQVLALAVCFGGGWQTIISGLVGVFIISGLFFAIFQFSKGRWIGFGDVKLGIVLGLLAGGALKALLVLFVASLLGTVLSAPMVFAGKANRKSHLPFGPLLIAGLIVVVLFGSRILDWYSSLIIGA